MPKKKGTGLGLFITQEIIAKHGGRIWVEAEEGKWADFRFVLPTSPVGCERGGGYEDVRAGAV